ncbi:hypothetical protein [Halomonas sp.]|jgi:hypothetical protein|uniref:hypothetical protein n=1 Tax=Halomonas sp. TaxID=1486246 RepID=UPI003564CA00
MSNGPYYHGECRCGAVTLMLCGTPLALGRDCRGEGFSFWPLDTLQFGMGLEEIVARDVSDQERRLACGRCGETLVVEHERVGVLALPGDVCDVAPGEAAAKDRVHGELHALGYHLDA